MYLTFSKEMFFGGPNATETYEKNLLLCAMHTAKCLGGYVCEQSGNALNIDFRTRRGFLSHLLQEGNVKNAQELVTAA